MANLPSNAADLTLTQLADKGCDFINSSVAAHVFANTAMKNIYQGEIEKGGRGVSQEYSDNTTGSSITVIRPLPLPIEARELGAAINGGNFSAFEYQPASDAYTLKVITTIDDLVDIPNVNLDMIPVGIAQMYVKNVSDKVTLNMNAIKIAAALYASFSAHQVDPDSAYVVEYDSANDKCIDKVTETYVQLDKGDEAHGVSMFPQDDRIGLITVDWYAKLLSEKGVFTLGGANYAYDLIRKGTLSTNAEQDKLADGYVGDLLGIPFHTVSPLVFATACRYLGFPRNEFKEVVAIIKSAHGNLFALASGSSIKTIDCPNGQGVRLQPLYRMGAACIMPKANAICVTTNFENPYGLKALFTSGVNWSYKAPGSRKPLGLTVTTAATKSVTASVAAGVTAVGNKYVQTDAAVSTVGDFLAAYNAAGAVKGAITTLGTAETISGLTVGKVINVLVIDGDGTVEIQSKVIA